MSTIPYTYTVVKYVHDPAAGEVLNIGVILWAPTQPFLGAKLEFRYERLSNTFVGFEGEHYKRTLHQLEVELDLLQQQYTDNLFIRSDKPQDVKQLVALIWPDEDLSFRTGPMLAGISDDTEGALEEIFDRLVNSQYPRQRAEKRTDEEVWTVYHRPLVHTKANKRLVPKVIATDEFSLKFDHSFKNEKWHVLEPVSMDYVKAESIQRKATTWLGNATALSGHPELGILYILLGKPRLEIHKKAYIKAKNLLHKMPIKHQLIEEEEAEDFAKNLAAYMKEHGVLKPDED